MLELAEKINKNSPIPVYKQIKSSIKKYLIEKKLKSGCPLPSESEIGKIFDVSRITARKAVTALVEENILHRVNGKGTFVAEKVVSGYSTTHKVIGIITPRFSGELKLDRRQSPTHYGIIDGLEQYFQQKQFDLSLLNASYTQLKENVLKNMPVAGIILLSPYKEHFSFIRKLKKCNKPFVAVNCFWDVEKINRINIDVFSAGYKAVELLVRKGRKNVIFMGQNYFDGGGLAHYSGYEQAMKDYNLIPKLYKLHIDKNRNFEFNIDDFMSFGKNCDGIVAGDDIMAIKFISTAIKRHIKIPDDISVCGFYDSGVCQHISPTLTSVKLPLEQLGIETGRKIFSLIRNPDSEPETINILPEILIREST